MKAPRARPAAIVSRVIEQWPDAVMIANRAGIIEYVNPAFEALTGFSRAEVLGRTPAMLRSGAQDGAFYRRLWREIRAGRLRASDEVLHVAWSFQPWASTPLAPFTPNMFACPKFNCC